MPAFKIVRPSIVRSIGRCEWPLITKRARRDAEQLDQGRVGEQRIAIIVRAHAGHVVFAQAVTKQDAAAWAFEQARLGQSREIAPRLGRHRFRADCVRHVAHFTGQQPAVVIAGDDQGAFGLQDRTRFGQIARAVGDVADGEQRVDADTPEVFDDSLQAYDLAMDVADDSRAPEHEPKV